MNIRPNVLIFSVFQKENTLEVNRAAHTKTMAELKSRLIPVVELMGKYDGVEEMSILVPSFQYRDMVESICKTNSQQCYLESHNDRSTSLVFPDGTRQSIGTLVGVSREEAEAVGAYSYNPVIDQYFVTR